MTINISLPEELVKQVDEQAKLDYESRSDYIRGAILQRLRATAASQQGKTFDGAIQELNDVIGKYQAALKNAANK